MRPQLDEWNRVYRYGALLSAGLRTDDGTTGTDITKAALQFTVSSRHMTKRKDQR